MVSDTVAQTPTTSTKLVAEAFGSFLLVFGLIATALFAAGFGEGTPADNRGVGFLGISLAVGLAVIAGAYAFGPVSGGHFNPAVTVGVAAAGRLSWREVPGYIIAQVVGGLIATTLIFLIGLFGPDGWLEEQRSNGFFSNGFDTLSPGGFGIGAAIVVEVVFTALFIIVILGVTHPRRGSAFGGLVIGLTLTLIHLAIIPIDNASVNPARSIATAVYGNTDALAHLWVFLVFPVLGALIAGYSYRALFDAPELDPAR